MVIRHHHTTAEPSKIFVGRIVHTKRVDELEIIANGAVIVAPDGTIVSVRLNVPRPDILVEEYKSNNSPRPELISLKTSQFLFPGMIDTHLHAPQWPNLALGMEGTLREWMEDYTDPMVRGMGHTVIACRLTEAHRRRVYADVVRTTLKLGSTSVAYNSSIHTEATNILADACLRAGQRAHVGRMSHTLASSHGNQDDSVEISLASAEASIKHIRDIDPKGCLLQASVQPRGGPYCPPELMQGLGKLCSKYRASVQAHMCETPDDISSFRFFPLIPNPLLTDLLFSPHSRPARAT
nr:putative guanine deaminase [Quercus suber]